VRPDRGGPPRGGRAMTADTGVRRRHTVVTPEGLPLGIEIASAGDRLAAFLLDFMLVLLLNLVVSLAFYLPAALLGSAGSALFGSLFLLASFLIWNGYFLYFELHGRGVTPGKRWLGLRVMSRNGGPLTTGAVFARNLMRPVELYLPLLVVISPGILYGAAPGWAVILSSVWLLILLLMPLLNRDRARCGDLVAGTLVVVKPEARLLFDPAERRDFEEEPEAYHFTEAQLDMYGIRELQVLEELLRHDVWKPNRRRVLRTVCEKIMHKIAWKDEVPEDRVIPFLQAFYRAQRSRLEQRLIMGERREKKRLGRLGAKDASKSPGPRGRRRRRS